MYQISYPVIKGILYMSFPQKYVTCNIDKGMAYLYREYVHLGQIKINGCQRPQIYKIFKKLYKRYITQYSQLLKVVSVALKMILCTSKCIKTVDRTGVTQMNV